MEPNTKNQPAENNHLKVGSKAVKRLKVRHLSQVARKAILDKFCATEDFQETADQLDIDGLTKDTVNAALMSFIIRKQPAQAQTATREVPFLMQRRGVA